MEIRQEEDLFICDGSGPFMRDLWSHLKMRSIEPVNQSSEGHDAGDPVGGLLEVQPQLSSHQQASDPCPIIKDNAEEGAMVK